MVVLLLGQPAQETAGVTVAGGCLPQQSVRLLAFAGEEVVVWGLLSFEFVRLGPQGSGELDLCGFVAEPGKDADGGDGEAAIAGKASSADSTSSTPSGS